MEKNIEWPFELCVTLHASHIPSDLYRKVECDSIISVGRKPYLPLPVLKTLRCWPGGYNDSSIMIHCPIDIVEEYQNEIDQELLTVIKWANSHGAEYVRFDEDGELIDDLPVYE